MRDVEVQAFEDLAARAEDEGGAGLSQEALATLRVVVAVEEIEGDGGVDGGVDGL